MPFRQDTLGYEDAVAQFADAIVSTTIEQDSFLGEIPAQTRAYPRSKIGVDESNPVNYASFHIEQIVDFDKVGIREGDVATFTSTLRQAAEGYRNQLGAQVAGKMLQMAEAGGKSLDAGGRPLSPELILELLEEYDFRFREDGAPIMP